MLYRLRWDIQPSLSGSQGAEWGRVECIEGESQVRSRFDFLFAQDCSKLFHDFQTYLDCLLCRLQWDIECGFGWEVNRKFDQDLISFMWKMFEFLFTFLTMMCLDIVLQHLPQASAFRNLHCAK